MLTCLIEKALHDNRELKILNEEVQIAGNEVLSRSGAYLPFVSVGAVAGLNRFSRFTEEGAGILDDPYLPGKHFTNPSGNFGTGLNLTWQVDIYRQLRNARDAATQRYVAASERRNYFVTTLVADICREFLQAHGARQTAREPGSNHRAQHGKPRDRQGQEGSSPQHRAGCPAFPGRAPEELQRKADHQSGDHPGRKPHQLPRQSLPAACRTRFFGILRSEDSPAERRSALATAPEPTRYPPGRARAGGRRARREGRPGQLLSSAGDQQRRRPRVPPPQSSVRAAMP